MSTERRIGFGHGLLAAERAEPSTTGGGGVPLEGRRRVSEGTERPKHTRARKQRHKEPHGDVSHGDGPHGDVNHQKRNKSRGSGRMAAVAWRRVPAVGSLVCGTVGAGGPSGKAPCLRQFSLAVIGG